MMVRIISGVGSWATVNGATVNTVAITNAGKCSNALLEKYLPL